MNGLLVGLLGLCILMIYYQHNLISRSRSLKVKEELENKLRILALNPNSHFSYNSLNSIKNLIQKKENNEASKYISTYGQVMRHNQLSGCQIYSLLKDELEGLLLFTDLERLRFKKGFEFTYHLDHTIDQYRMWIPGCFLQPLIEYTIWNSIDTERKDPVLVVLALTSYDLILECCIRVNSFPRQVLRGDNSLDEDAILNDWLRKRIAIFNNLESDHIEIKKIKLIDSLNNEKGIEINLRLPVRTGSSIENHQTMTL